MVLLDSVKVIFDPSSKHLPIVLALFEWFMCSLVMALAVGLLAGLPLIPALILGVVGGICAVGILLLSRPFMRPPK